jgi:hypothetical protein
MVIIFINPQPTHRLRKTEAQEGHRMVMHLTHKLRKSYIRLVKEREPNSIWKASRTLHVIILFFGLLAVVSVRYPLLLIGAMLVGLAYSIYRIISDKK